MAQLMRKCSQCGTLDTRAAWSSPDEAAKDGAFARPWACASCAWTEFELVDPDTETPDRQATAGSR